MTEYEVLMKEHSGLKSQKKDIEERLDAIKEDVENLMWRDKINEIEVDSQDDKMWTCKWQETSRKKVDYPVLKDLTSDQDYDLIVSETTSESLVIREKKSVKKVSKPKRGAPKPINQTQTTPSGTTGVTQNIPLV